MFIVLGWKNRATLITVLLFGIFTIWWIYLRSTIAPGDPGNQLFTATYGLVALFGGIWGVSTARKWGGFKSILGRSLLMFSFGLFAQEFGQLAYNYYIYYLNIDIPYPSIGDVGYFGSVLFYIYGIWLLAKAAGVKLSIRNIGNKIVALLIPLALLTFSYLFFLRGYEFDWSAPLTIFLDFGYPFGEALYISVALLTYLLSMKLLGGVMRNKILFILFAMLVQYTADFNFLFQAYRETWADGGYGDYLYLVAYFIMTLALLRLRNTYSEIREPGAA